MTEQPSSRRYVPEFYQRFVQGFIVQAPNPEGYDHKQFNPIDWVNDTLPRSQSWDIYGIHGLPAQISAALFSRFSRTHLSAKNLLVSEFWEEINHLQPPRETQASGYSHEFFDRVLGAYGDESVAEMGTLDIVLEGIPIWLAMLVQNARFGFSCIEKSTRYVPNIVLSGLPYPTRFDETNQALIDRWRDLYKALIPALEKTLKRPAGILYSTWQRTLQAHALDCTRGLLPLGTATNVAVHANARAWSDIICDLLAYGNAMADPNATALGEMILHVCLTMAPALFRDFTDGKGKDRMQIKIKALEADLKTVWDESFEEEPFAVYLSRQSQADVWVGGGIPSRPTRHTKIPRDKAHNSTMTMQAGCSIAAYRDMRRGRRLAWSQPLTSRQNLLNLRSHPMLTPLGGQVAPLGEQYLDYLYDVATMTVAEDTPDWEQWYSLPLATPCRFNVTGDMPAWSWLCELRSSQQGHYEYRQLAQRMAQTYLGEYSQNVQAALAHVDYSESGLARLAAEHKKDRSE